ncbi:ABC transporter ATP-binding protein [Roseovarius sp. D22-M7]|uniref:ABC transporter ATP-binding protein n=1 Tax=Roseovarius sp. D22-M7 TaxID=3127116 RepID=UPI00300FD2B3
MMLLQARGLTRRFEGLHAVQGVDLDLPEGEIRALIGPNGAGKTTLVGLISGRVSPDAGRVTFDGRDVTRLPAHRRIALGMGYTFQITSVFGRLSVAENVGLAARRHRRGAAARQEVEDALERVGLSAQAGAEAGDLAYGHQRLLELAMGIAQRPRLLILDEPTQGLSDGEIAGFETLIRELARTTTILLIEHNMRVVTALAQRITVLDRGRVLAEGTPDEIHADAAVQAAYLGGSRDAARR